MAFLTSIPPSGASAEATGTAELYAFLQKTSRTFALTIPMLPEPLRTEIGIAYLLFRIIDTFEDASAWPPAQRISALRAFEGLLDHPDERAASSALADWTKVPPVAHQGYVELLGAAPKVLHWYRRLDAPVRMVIGGHLRRSALGMCEFVQRSDEQGLLRLVTMQDLRGYCFVVAGIVGQMLTELFLLSGGGALATVAAELRARSRAFGEGLQLVNILKDAGADAAEGRIYLPREVLLAEVFVLARADLRAAAEYTELLRLAGAHRGLVAFNALNARLAIATLRLLRDRGLGSKLTRPQVAGLAAEVAHALEVGAPLFDRATLDQA